MALPAPTLSAYPEQLRAWHDPTTQGTHRWRLTDRGLEVSEGGLLRTRGAPRTATHIIDTFSESLARFSREAGVLVELLIATIATESGGNSGAVRLEPGYASDDATPYKISVGLCQTLIGVAREVMGPELKAGLVINRSWLYSPPNSICAGARCIARRRSLTNFDPPLVAAAYNAGSLRPSTRNPWGLICTDDRNSDPSDGGDHVTRFVRFFNDAWAVLRGI